MANFWHSHWIEGKSPKSIAPAIFAASKRKNRTVREALTSNSWIRDINLLHLTSGDHLRQYVELWTLIHNRTPLGQQRDTITWKLTLTREYTKKSAYRVQFLGAAKSFFNETIWKCWAPPKCKFFAWLVMQNRVCTADRLKKRGWRNQQYCPLCHTTLETAVHLLAHCRFSQCIWLDIQRWTGLNLNIHNWDRCASVEDWWYLLTHSWQNPAKAVKTLIILISWELWCERNARIFRHNGSPPMAVVNKIKGEAATWVLAGASSLSAFTTLGGIPYSPLPPSLLQGHVNISPVFLLSYSINIYEAKLLPSFQKKNVILPF